MQQQSSDEHREQVIPQKPDYGEVDGEAIKLSGLDYSLLRQQNLDKNQNLLSQIKNKLNVISGNVLSRKIEQQRIKQKAVSQYDTIMYHKIRSVFQPNSSLQINRKKKAKTHSALFYQFDIDFEFGKKLPIIIQKRLGKVQMKEVFNHYQDSFINQLQKLMSIKSQQQQLNSQSSQLINANSDSDDIFGDDSKQYKDIDINIGKKLDFGLKQDDIFGQYQAKNRPEPFRQIQQDPRVQQKDKYFFMRKQPQKASKSQKMEDGYDQCYQQNGPTLKQLVDMKKQGIEYFGQEKQFKKKQRKINIHKDYQKIQKIIEEKNKK